MRHLVVGRQMDEVIHKLSLNPASLGEAHLEGKAVVGKEKDLSALAVLTSCRVLVMSKCNITSLAAFPALDTLKKVRSEERRSRRRGSRFAAAPCRSLADG